MSRFLLPITLLCIIAISSVSAINHANHNAAAQSPLQPFFGGNLPLVGFQQRPRTPQELAMDAEMQALPPAFGNSHMLHAMNGVDPSSIGYEEEEAELAASTGVGAPQQPATQQPTTSNVQNTNRVAPGYLTPPTVETIYATTAAAQQAAQAALPADPLDSLKKWDNIADVLNTVEMQLDKFDVNATRAYPQFFQVTGTALSARLGAISHLNSTLAQYVDTVVNFDDHISAIDNADKESQLWLSTKYSIMAVLQSMSSQMMMIKQHVDFFAEKFDAVKESAKLSHKQLSTKYVKTLADGMLHKDKGLLCSAMKFAEVAVKMPPSSTGAAGEVEPVGPALGPGANGEKPNEQVVGGIFRQAILGHRGNRRFH